MHEVIELSLLDALAEFAGVGKTVQHRRHPPGKAHGLPDPGKRFLRISIDAGHAFVAVDVAQTGKQITHVTGGKVESFGPGRRHDVGSIADQEKPAKAQRLGNEGAQRAIDFSKDGPVTTAAAVCGGNRRRNSSQKAVVGPRLDMIVEWTLHIVAAAVRRAHRAQRKTRS